MAVVDTFSKRKRLKDRAQDPYQYDDLPAPFRVQVVHIWRSALGWYWYDEYNSPSPSNQVWSGIHDLLARELGVFELTPGSAENAQVRCERFLQEAATDQALDIIELSFRMVERVVVKLDWDDHQAANISQDADAAIEELNARFREHSIGYQYVDGFIIELNSDYVHNEVVRPALSLLHDAGMQGPAQEFLTAHEHYRHGRNKEALGEALKAFESTMQAICDARGWAYAKNATAKPLLDVIFNEGLIPPNLQSQFAALRSLLESGLPTVANAGGRHGQGSTRVALPDHVAAYALHTAAANIVHLVEAHKALK